MKTNKKTAKGSWIVRMEKHSKQGNCWANGVVYTCPECGLANLCDVCHEHDEPRGECSECEDCAACDDETSERIFGKEYEHGE